MPSADVRAFAAANGATSYDVPAVIYTHVGPECSLDAFIRLHDLRDPALAKLTTIVRGADTASLHLATASARLLAVSRGLSALFADDLAMLKWGMLVYDALYESCRAASSRTATTNGGRA